MFVLLSSRSNEPSLLAVTLAFAVDAVEALEKLAADPDIGERLTRLDAADRHLAAAHDVVAACPCDAGCPSCVQSPKCGNWNEFLDKKAAVALMRAMLG